MGPGKMYQLAAIYFAVKAPLAAKVDIGSAVPVGRKTAAIMSNGLQARVHVKRVGRTKATMVVNASV